MLRFVHCYSANRLATRRFLHFSLRLDKLIQFNLSDIGEGIAEVQLKEWHVKVGDKINEFDNLCEVQSDKAAVTITSRYDGIIKKLYYQIDDVARVGTPLIDIEVGDEAGNAAESEQKEAPPKPTEVPPKPTEAPPKPTEAAQITHVDQSLEDRSHSRFLATPAVRRLVKEHKLSIQQVQGSGKDGRVLKEDVLKHLGQSVPEQSQQKSAVPPPPSQPTFTPKLTEDRVVPIKGYTRAMIHSMSEALKIPHFGYNDEFTMDELIRLRDALKHEAKHRHHLKLTYLPIIIKATSLALTEFPQLNAQADEKQDNLIYKANHNITVAMDTPNGLVVPNIKYCEQKNIWEIAADLIRIQEAGKQSKIPREDLQGGTFTLSNIGIIGGTYASPVLLPPQIVIGALGRIRKLPRFDSEENLIASNIMNISWAADHRYVDGATLARFSNRLKEFIENPSKLVAAMR